MDIPLLIAQALIFIFPAYCANGTPVLQAAEHAWTSAKTS